MGWSSARWVVVSAAFVASIAFGQETGSSGSRPAAPGEPAPFVRVAEDKAGVLTLELASRSYRRPDGTGPTVLLVSAVHIADKCFYQAKQTELDACDLVLFEGVKSTGMGAISDELDDAGKTEATRKRMAFLAQLAVAGRERSGAFAKDLAALAADSGRLKSFVERSSTDGWGHPLALSVVDVAASEGTPASQHAQLRSRGSDGKEGGEGPAADLVVDSDPVPVDKAASAKREENIQSRMAKMLGVAFQLDEMDPTKANWRNSDMDVDQLRVLLEKSGPNAAMILRMLDGSSFEAKVAGLFLSLIGTSKTLTTVVKVVMLDQLANAEQGFERGLDMPGAKGLMEAMQKVIIGDRNRIVLDDLKRVIAQEADKRTIAIFYGAGHMPAFERSLNEELGLAPLGDTWTAAMRVDPKDAGISRAQLKQMREWVGTAVKRTRSAK